MIRGFTTAATLWFCRTDLSSLNPTMIFEMAVYFDYSPRAVIGI